MYQEILWGKERMGKVKLISCGKKQATHVDWQKICAVAASNHNCVVEQATARNTHLRWYKSKENAFLNTITQ